MKELENKTQENLNSQQGKIITLESKMNENCINLEALRIRCDTVERNSHNQLIVLESELEKRMESIACKHGQERISNLSPFDQDQQELLV